MRVDSAGGRVPCSRVWKENNSIFPIATSTRVRVRSNTVEGHYYFIMLFIKRYTYVTNVMLYSCTWPQFFVEAYIKEKRIQFFATKRNKYLSIFMNTSYVLKFICRTSIFGNIRMNINTKHAGRLTNL